MQTNNTTDLIITMLRNAAKLNETITRTLEANTENTHSAILKDLASSVKDLTEASVMICEIGEMDLSLVKEEKEISQKEKEPKKYRVVQDKDGKERWV